MSSLNRYMYKTEDAQKLFATPQEFAEAAQRLSICARNFAHDSYDKQAANSRYLSLKNIRECLAIMTDTNEMAGLKFAGLCGKAARIFK